MISNPYCYSYMYSVLVSLLNAIGCLPQVLSVAAALAQVCAKSHQFPTFSGSKDKKVSESGKNIVLYKRTSLAEVYVSFSLHTCSTATECTIISLL